MAVLDQVITNQFAIYCGDAVEIMASLPSSSIDLSIYSPPFVGLYLYSSDERDLSNSLTKEEFFQHYEFVVREISRLTRPGRMTAVHCADIPKGSTSLGRIYDFPGDIIRLHESLEFDFVARYHVWKEPLTVRNRTMMKSLSHKQLTNDSTKCNMANADQLLIFRRKGHNIVPVIHPVGLIGYAGERTPPPEVLPYRGWRGNQIDNLYSHWIWQQYASAFWDDVRLDRVLPYKPAREEDEKHVHPLQLDVIERCLVLWSNEGEIVLDPFVGVGSVVYGAVINNRRAIGIELKLSYYRQAIKNLMAVERKGFREDTQMGFLEGMRDVH